MVILAERALTLASTFIDERRTDLEWSSKLFESLQPREVTDGLPENNVCSEQFARFEIRRTSLVLERTRIDDYWQQHGAVSLHETKVPHDVLFPAPQPKDVGAPSAWERTCSTCDDNRYPSPVLTMKKRVGRAAHVRGDNSPLL